MARWRASVVLFVLAAGVPLARAETPLLVRRAAPVLLAQTPPVVATPAPAAVVAQMRTAVEQARRQFEARDQASLLATVSEQYRSSGITKPALRDQLQAMFGLYRELQARVTVDRVEMVNGGAWVYTTGEVAGRLPMVGWVTVLTWQTEPEVVRREATGWRLFGFQD
jgi:hypothetical protein